MEAMRLRGFLLILVLSLSSFLYTIFLLAPAIPLLLVPPPLYMGARHIYRRWMGFVAYLWFALASYLLETFCGIKVLLSGDPVPCGESALIICNHRCRVDWMFLWCMCLRQGQLSGLKIVLKDALKSVPGFGWAMQMFMFVFLARDRRRDVVHMRRVGRYLHFHGVPTSLLIFPEGTDLSANNLKKSQAFAAERGLPLYKHILHPKVKGFSECLQVLRPQLDAVHDVTIAYRDYKKGERASEEALLAGQFPREVHMHVKRHSVQDMPLEEEEVQEIGACGQVVSRLGTLRHDDATRIRIGGRCLQGTKIVFAVLCLSACGYATPVRGLWCREAFA
ncbi:unnamed protein product [Discosporangium mesarthrocarpum]